MLYFDRIYISEEIDVIKSSKSKELIFVTIRMFR